MLDVQTVSLVQLLFTACIVTDRDERGEPFSSNIVSLRRNKIVHTSFVGSSQPTHN